MIVRVLFLFFFAGPVYAQVPTDSLIHYQLGDIVVSPPDGTSSEGSSVSTTQRIRLAQIAQADAASIDKVLLRIPSAHVQTNSRGETLIYLRGSGERQVSLFFDGALLNVPWDNRVDLSLIPSEVVGEISISKGVPSVLYGANVLGGAINMTSRQLRNQGSFSQLTGILGSQGSQQARLTWLQRTKQFQSTIFVGISDQDGFSLPKEVELPHSQGSDALRTNTDRRMRSFFGEVSFDATNDLKIGVSLLRFDGHKGIAPEGHISPIEGNVRYWRYPSWATNMAIISGEYSSRFGQLHGAAWISRFGQTIVQYSDESYTDERKSQMDQDDTYGIRLTYLRDFENSGSIRAATTLIGSTHDQKDVEIGHHSLQRLFSQRILSNGIEYIRGDAFKLTLGASMDLLMTPKTGDKPARGSQMGYGFTAGVSYDFSERFKLRAVIGRKTRFPTMRELFGEALGRFLLNPDLKEESSLLSEVAATIHHQDTDLEVIAFFNRSYNTIGQQMVMLPSESRPRRKRVNLEGSRVFGIESTIHTSIIPSLRLSCSLTVMRSREVTANGTQPLVESPSWIGWCDTNYRFRSGLSLIVESHYSANAYGLGLDNQLISLPNSFVINTRISWLIVYGKYSLELFGRVNNLNDEIVLPQLGLPGPGRELHGGLQVTF